SISRETTRPVVTFTPATLPAASGATAMSTLTATDNVGVTTGPDVTCSLGSFANNTYTAPFVSADTRDTCIATAIDAAGNAGTATLTISVARETTPPVVTFTPATLTVNSGGTGASTLTATDNVAVTTGPDVTCDAGSFANNTYTAPVVSAGTGATCTATASDAAGNAGTATLTVSIARETTPPVVTFTPATLLVGSGGTGMSRVSATDAVDGTVAPTVSCTNGGSYDTGTGMFTAPTVAGDTASVCTATATDTAGNAGTATLTVSVFAIPDVTPPVLTFSPATLTADSGATVMSTLTATDNAGVTTGPDVDCTQGSYDPDTGTYTAPDVGADTMDTCTATARDAAGNAGTGTLTVSVTGDREPPQLSFSRATLIVDRSASVRVALTATDNVGIATGPTVTCTNGGSYDTGTGIFTAPTGAGTRNDVSVLCTATATDTAGNAGTAALTVTVAADRKPPELSFTPATLDEVESGGTVALTVTATDNVGVTTGPDVTCLLGSFANNMYTAPVVSFDTTDTCTATAWDAFGNVGTKILPIPVAMET
ncbi:MAG: hypothetical protein GDA39_08625, partial [Hyphomonadaceae bacterium]|nr:hypothetical protein [Hyphomonadaceae bacterium]